MRTKPPVDLRRKASEINRNLTQALFIGKQSQIDDADMINQKAIQRKEFLIATEI